MGTSGSPGGEFLNFGNTPRISPAAAAKIASRPIAQNRCGHRNCYEPAKRKGLGRSGTFLAQWFRRWTLESATRVRSPHGPLQQHQTASYPPIWRHRSGNPPNIIYMQKMAVAR